MVAPGAKKPKARHDAAALRARHEALAQVEEKFRDFDVVWAKVHGFPWWPGVLFHSWDVVRRAGVRTDPKIVASLPVPPPEKVPILDAATGEDTGLFRVRRHCLVMFLDKFNFSLVEIAPANVASFTAHYQVYEHAVMGSKNKKKTEFRRALLKATQLLHIGKEFEEDDLVMLEEPSPAEKKQRMDEVMGVDEQEEDQGDASLDDAWDDPEMADGADFGPEVEEVADEKKPARKKQPSGRRRKAEVKDAESEGEDDVVILTPAKPRRKAPAKDAKHRARKPSRKEGHSAAHVAVVSPSPSPIDLTGTPEDEGKKPHKEKPGGKGSGKPPKARKKKVNGDAAGKRSKSKKHAHVATLVLEDDDDDEFQPSAEHDSSSEQVSDGVEDVTREEKPRNLVLTPLASIWTTPAAGDESSGAGAPTQLAYKQAFVWDNAVFTDELSIAEKDQAEAERKQVEDALAHAGPGRDRSLGKRQSRSVQQSHIRQNLMSGNLDPHTMVQCAAYRPKDFVEDPNSRSRGGPTLDPPFQVVVHPDAVFVADLHAHLATCEIIGFLGGKWDEASNTLYIQAAFPCRSLVIDGDDGSTDVEMDPGSEIELRGIIENAQLEVVGWYHSHPAFAPDPSVRDIENQTSYQQLFQRSSNGSSGGKKPFVGLIVGTYDTRRSTAVSLFRYFHTRGEKVSGGACREIYMPYEFIPGRRHFRSVLQDEERERTRSFPMYASVLRHFKLELSSERQQLPTDAKVSTPRKAASKSSPARVRAHGPVRKRKQSSGNDADQPTKKTKGASRRASRSATNHVDLTGDDDDRNSRRPENSVVPTVERAAEQKGDSVVPTVVGTTSSNGHTSHAKKGEQAAPSSNALVISPEVGSVGKEVAQVVADAVAVVGSGGKQKKATKGLTPERIHESVSSSSGDERKKLPTNGTVGQREDAKAPGRQHVDVGVAGAPAAAKSSSASSAAKPSASPAAGSGSSGRKRNRKPKKTTKNSNRSASPVSDGPSPGMSPSPSSAGGQTFYNVFQAGGPRISNGGTPEEAPQPVARADDPTPENGLVEDDIKYISINLTDDWAAEDKAGEGVQKAPGGGLVTQEVRKYVSALVEQVLESVANGDATTCAQDGKTASCSWSVVDEPSAVATDQHLGNAVAKRGVENEPLKLEPAVPASRSAAGKAPRLFGSNGQCEDIQTSLQRMDKYLNKLKAVQVPKSSEGGATPEKEAPPEAEATLVEEPAPKQDGSGAEQEHLAALRTKYGAGVSGCAEQVITLVDYYRDFERRTDLSEIWKARTTKLEKIERSLSEYVQFLDLPAALRHDFIKDLVSYLRESWATKGRRR